MKPFHLDSHMVTMGGVFYPTGYMVLMFPTEQEARDAVQKLADDGWDEDEISLLTPGEFDHEIVQTLGVAETPLPSAGTEGDTVRRFADLAAHGHHALMIHAPSSEEADRAMKALAGCNISYGQRYRRLVIEDIVT